MQYKVRWVGLGEEADSWEPVANLLNARARIDEYNNNLIEELRSKIIPVSDINHILSGMNKLREENSVIRERQQEMMSYTGENQQLRVEMTEK